MFEWARFQGFTFLAVFCTKETIEEKPAISTIDSKDCFYKVKILSLILLLIRVLVITVF